MIILKHLTMKNFLSVGNVTQSVNFNQNDITLILGENLDQGGNGSRNGCGKSVITHALSYVIFGQPLTKIKVDNLINQVNGKDMLVTLTFEKNGIEYRIERGRKQAVFKFYINDVDMEKLDNEAQGESRETQHEIDKLFMMDHLMYKNIISLNTYTEPFLAMKAADQRDIIENLLGVTILSDKAEVLKAQIKTTKDSITKVSATIEANIAANNKIKESIDRLKQTQATWVTNKETDIQTLIDRITRMQEFDIDAEIKNHEIIQERDKVKHNIDTLKMSINTLEQSLVSSDTKIKQFEKSINSLSDNKCPTCEQGLHSDKHHELVSAANSNLNAELTYMNDVAVRLQPLYDEMEALKLSSAGLFDNSITTVYKTLQDALSHKNNLNNLIDKLETKYQEIDPYASQISELETSALTDIDYTEINDLTRLKDHQDLLLKLLTNKDSFLRKQIIDQNLSYLNTRLDHYLDKIGLPHSVTFNNDLSVDIVYLGKELDFYNLSRGEMTRVSLSLSFAFRDVWENLFQPINLLFVDEALDSGMDFIGAMNSMALLNEFKYNRNKSIFLISHKEELASHSTNVLKAIKEHGFTTYSYE
jgi:DNA repair exonuclease SbcCD ATPase subunit